MRMTDNLEPEKTVSQLIGKEKSGSLLFVY